MSRKSPWIASVLLPAVLLPVILLGFFWINGSRAGQGTDKDDLAYVPGGKVRLGSGKQEKAFGYSIGGAARRSVPVPSNRSTLCESSYSVISLKSFCGSWPC